MPRPPPPMPMSRVYVEIPRYTPEKDVKRKRTAENDENAPPVIESAPSGNTRRGKGRGKGKGKGKGKRKVERKDGNENDQPEKKEEVNQDDTEVPPQPGPAEDAPATEPVTHTTPEGNRVTKPSPTVEVVIPRRREVVPRKRTVEVVIERRRPLRAPAPRSPSRNTSPPLQAGAAPVSAPVSPSPFVGNVERDVDVIGRAGASTSANDQPARRSPSPLLFDDDNDSERAVDAAESDTPLRASTPSPELTPSRSTSVATPASPLVSPAPFVSPLASALSFVSPRPYFGKQYRIERADTGWMRDLGFVPILGGGYYTCPPSEACTECIRQKQPCNIAPLRIVGKVLRRIECQACSKSPTASCSGAMREYAATRVLTRIGEPDDAPQAGPSGTTGEDGPRRSKRERRSR